MADFPIHPDEFSLEWLEEVLGSPRGAIKAISSKPIGTGQVAASYRVQLDRDPVHGPTSYVVKAPSMNEISRQTGIDSLCYARETSWYEKLVAQSDIRCPTKHHIEFDPTTQHFLLFLEDCAPATQGDQLVGVGSADIEAALREAAALHAPFWGKLEIGQDPLFSISPEQLDERVATFNEFWPAFRERYTQRLDPAILEMGEDFAKRFDAYARRTPNYVSLVHGDFRVDNMLFGAPDGRVVVLDWQTVAMGMPAMDAAYLVGTSIADSDRSKAQERAFFESYLSNLESYGVRVDAEKLWDDYRVGAFSGLVMAIMASMVVGRTERGDEMFAVMAERPARQVMALDSLSLF